MKKLQLIAILGCIVTASCGPGQMVGTGYLVTVEQGVMTKWKKLDNTSRVDSFVYSKTGMQLQADSLIHPRYPFYQFRNGRYSIYVEKQGVYQRRANGKHHWRLYDEQLEKK